MARLVRRSRPAIGLVLLATVAQGLVTLAAGPGAVASVQGIGAWTATSPLATARTDATSTTLDGPACRVAAPAPWCGKVLVAGGWRTGAFNAFSSAEVYDPGTGRWSSTGAMHAARRSHTATLLDGAACHTAAPPAYCGKVLVAGGVGGPAFQTALDSAELYDPATGEWSPTGRMGPLGGGGTGQPRYMHTASALDGPACRGKDLSPLPAPDWCGDVLVVGGSDLVPGGTSNADQSTAAINTATLYDPATGAWRATGSPSIGRLSHTLTALDGGPCDTQTPPPPYCGRLLLAGGRVTAPVGVGLATAELYDPDVGGWVPTGAMLGPRFAHRAVLLGGPVCRRASPQCNKVLVTGGLLQASTNNLAAEASAELYDPLTGAWVPTGNKLSLEVPPDDAPLAPQTEAPLPTRGMGIGRGQFHTLTVLDGPACRPAPPALPAPHCGKVLVVGDEASVTFGQAPPELYDPDGRDPETGIMGTFSPTLPRLFQASGHGLLIDGAGCGGLTPMPDCGRVLVFGGDAGARLEAELFDASQTSQPPTVASLDPRSGPAHGGATVILRGAGFSGATEVRFGAVVAAAFRVEGDGRLVAFSPAMAAGEVDVTVEVGGRTSAAIAATRFAVFPSNLEWADTGSLVFKRPGPSVTPLLDGRALLVGGRSSPSNHAAVDSVEVFDPSTGRWDPASPLATARSNHTATRLSSGEVLVAGGSGPGCCPPLASAEVYNPATGLWRRTGSMARTRAFHTATLLWSGKVLVTGGRAAGDEVLASAELYDPDAIDPASGERGVWTPATPMRSYRRGHHAALLADGRVLVVGGTGCDSTPEPPVEQGEWEPSCGEPIPPGGDPVVDFVLDPTGGPTVLRSAEVYDPEAGPGGGWSPTGSLSAPRAFHTTTALSNGKVLVAGGEYTDPPELYEPEITDPATGAMGTWRAVQGTAGTRKNHTATVLAGPTCAELCGHVLLVGGSSMSSAELYDPATGAWKPAPPLAAARESHGAALLTNGQVLVVGGNGPGQPPLTGSAELFRVDAGQPVVAALEPPTGPPGTQVVIRGADLSGTTKVNFGGISVEPVAVTESVVVARSPLQPRGTVPVSVITPLGQSYNNALSRSDDFTYPSGRWRAGPAMSTERYLHTSTLLDGAACRRPAPPSYCGRVLVAGGSANFSPLADQVPIGGAELYDPDVRRWVSTGAMRSARFNHTATLLDGPACQGDGPPAYCGKVLVAGGLVGTDAITAAELYDPALGTWASTTPLKSARMSHTATLLADGRVLVVGGAADEPHRGGLQSVEIYDPASGTWKDAAPMAEGRNSHTATLLANGQVLVAGGLRNAEGGGNDLVGSAEVFDPSTGKWAAVEALAVARFAHTAVRLDGPRCGAACGKVLVVGGVRALDDDGVSFQESAELFDPGTRTWSPASAPGRPRAGHTATLLPNGQVLVTGGRMTFPADSTPPPLASVELYDPLTGRWSLTEELATRRGIHSASLLDGPACRGSAPPAYCGTVVIAGGATAGMAPGSTVSPLAVKSTELYAPAPDVHRLLPPAGTADGGTTVVLSGAQFAGASAVRFGGRDAASFVVDSPTSITAVSPPADDFEPVEVTVEGPGGGSALIGGNPAASYAYLGRPGAVTALVARAVSATAIELSFAAADAGDGSTPAQDYVVKQSDAEITEANFDAPSATALCGGTCRFTPPALAYTLRVGDLEPGLTYHYALRAVNEKGRGPLSASVSATTENLAQNLPTACPQSAPGGAGTVVYPGGRYSLIGLPGGSVVRSQSPLYGWTDLGAGGSYSVLDGAGPVTGGRGYWAWFSCSHAVTLPSGAGAGGPITLPLGAYHASMVGNPTTTPATVRGHDFAAVWDAQAGAYRMSGYRQPQTLAVGEGAWTFSYSSTEVRISPSG